MEKGLNLVKTSEKDPKLPYRQLLGQLLWIACCTRPDILFSFQYMSQFANCACREHWMALIRVLRYLKTTIDDTLTLRIYDKTTCTSYCNLSIVETDSDWASDHTDR
eukprot:8207667-Pyramimonas_sp.AAC.1